MILNNLPDEKQEVIDKLFETAISEILELFADFGSNWPWMVKQFNAMLIWLIRMIKRMVEESLMLTKK